MKILKGDTIQNIRDRFESQFPGLSIKFYNKSHENGKSSPLSEELDAGVSMVRLIPDIEDQDFELTKDKLVKEIEALFEYELGLHVQILRQSGKVMLQTSSTDHWSLLQQMDHVVT